MPEGSELSRLREIERLADAADEEPDYQLPDITSVGYLISALSELGEAKIVGDRLASIDWHDINEWIKATHSQITIPERIALKRLSSEYVTQYNKSIKKDALAPHVSRSNNREVVAKKIDSLFSMLRK